MDYNICVNSKKEYGAFKNFIIFQVVFCFFIHFFKFIYYLFFFVLTNYFMIQSGKSLTRPQGAEAQEHRKSHSVDQILVFGSTLCLSPLPVYEFSWKREGWEESRTVLANS